MIKTVLKTDGMMCGMCKAHMGMPLGMWLLYRKSFREH